MKSRLKSFMYFFFAMALAFVSCTKDQKEQSNPGGYEIQFVLSSLPGETPGNTAGLYAILTIQKANTAEVVIVNKRLMLTYNGKYLTEKITLAEGGFKLVKFLILDSSGRVLFATPVAGSIKAAQVQTPLAIGFHLPQSTLLQVPVQVLKVVSTDKAADFGYPAGTFNDQVETPGQTFKIKMKAAITVGAINYDSIPADLRVITWDANGVAHEKQIALEAGANEITLPKSHLRFQFKLAKWGVSDELTLTRDQISEGTTYILGGSKALKKLLLEETYLFASGNYQPSGKTVYKYNGNGSLNEVQFFQKLPQHSNLQLTHKNIYWYSGSNVSRINVVEANGTTSGFTDFIYNAQGTKVVQMHRKNYDQETFAAVDYSYPTGQAVIRINYLYSNGNTMEYTMNFRGGNKMEDAAVSNNGGEGGTYQYDFNINPYAHLNMPDIFLSNLSKNNLVGQQKHYSGGFPSGNLYKLEYSYNAEGYPVEVVKYYRSVITGEDLYKTKTIFTYL